MIQSSADYLQKLNYFITVLFSQCGGGCNSEGEGKKAPPGPHLLLKTHHHHHQQQAAAVVHVAHVPELHQVQFIVMELEIFY